jgi:hypothetical protein
MAALTTYAAAADFDDDGYVNEADLAILAGKFGKSDCLSLLP